MTFALHSPVTVGISLYKKLTYNYVCFFCGRGIRETQTISKTKGKEKTIGTKKERRNGDFRVYYFGNIKTNPDKVTEKKSYGPGYRTKTRRKQTQQKNKPLIHFLFGGLLLPKPTRFLYGHNYL